jgi:hypothetical protein
VVYREKSCEFSLLVHAQNVEVGGYTLFVPHRTSLVRLISNTDARGDNPVISSLPLFEG